MRKALGIIPFIALLVMTLAQAVPAQQEKSVSEESYSRAHSVLESGIKALGGLEALRDIKDITREMTGTRSDQGQGMWPVPPSGSSQPPVTNTYHKATSVRDLRGQRAMEYRETAIFGGQPLTYRNVATGTLAFFARYGTKVLRQSPPAAITSVRAGMFRRYPESLLQTAWARPETLRWLGEAEYGGRKQRIISFADVDGTVPALYFDAENNLLTKTEVLTDDPLLGDTTTELIFSDWRTVKNLMLPFRFIDKLGGSIFQDFRVSATTLNTNPPDAFFALPDGFATLAPISPTPAAKKLADDVYALLGPYNSLFVVLKDYVLVVEAGANSNYTQASIAEIKKMAPDKPIRYVVSTHFHFDHLSGVRSFIAEGTTIITTPSARTIIESAATEDHSMRPDILARRPRAPVNETFKDRRVFEDGTHKVELYAFSNPHCGEMIVAYLPKEKILLEADMFDLDIPEGGTPSAGDDTAGLADQIQRLGLQVEQIIPVHGRLGTISDLRRAMETRTAVK